MGERGLGAGSWHVGPALHRSRRACFGGLLDRTGPAPDVAVAPPAPPQAPADQPTDSPAAPPTACVSDACIETPGVVCRACEGACDVSAIRFRPRLGGGYNIAIDQASCTGCGDCLARCPVAAIAMVPRAPDIQHPPEGVAA